MSERKYGERVYREQCAAVGCSNGADPRWWAHAQRTGRAVNICDGHEGTPCKATTFAECTCPVVFDDVPNA